MNSTAIDFQKAVKPISEPEPLRAPIPKPEPYPVKALGNLLGNAVNALQNTIKAPEALCSQSVLAGASLAAQAHFDVELPWGEVKPLSLFLLTVAESGERKTGVDNVVLGPAKDQERKDMKNYETLKEVFDRNIESWNNEIKTTGNKLQRVKNRPTIDDAQAAQAESKPKAPLMPLRFVSEPTVEGLYKLMAIGQPSLGLFSDEGGLLIGGHALNSDNALKTLARLCKLWDGSAFDRVRGGDGSGILYGRRLALHQLAQPEVMTTLLSDRMANGQGFLARCLVAWPESTIGSRHINCFEQPGDCPEVKILFEKLNILMAAKLRTSDNEQELDPLVLSLDEDAKKLAIKAINQFETLMQRGADLAELRDRTSKAVENACRLAGVMTVIEDGSTARNIDANRLGRGLVLIQWYLSEALRIRSMTCISQAVSDAESLSKWLAERDYNSFRSKQVLNKGPSHLRNKTRFYAAIKELLNNGYIAENEPETMVDGVMTRKSWKVLYVV